MFEPEAIKYAPPNAHSVINALPFLLASALLKGRVGIAEVLEEKLKDPEVLALAKKVTRSHDPALEGRPHVAPVSIRTKDGRICEYTHRGLKGSPQLPATREELEDKFRANAELVLPKARVEAVIRTIAKLEKVDRVSELMSLLQKG